MWFQFGTLVGWFQSGTNIIVTLDSRAFPHLVCSVEAAPQPSYSTVTRVDMAAKNWEALGYLLRLFGKQ
jgi:hypothetical protein